MSYIQLTSPLVLHADPVLPEHAVTKRYVDGKKNAVDASWFTAGVIPTVMMPALSGDVSSVAGSGTATLSATGVTAGSYTKVGVSSSGRVVSGSTLAASDIPNVSWSKITTGKPSTASGYGITNLISLSGGTASGAIVSSATPSGAMHAVTKGYVDNAVVGVVSGTLNVGDVVRKPVTTAPTGFLRCNGGLVDKTTYNNLFNVLGYSLYLTVTLDYTSSGAVGSGRPWEQQYDINLSANTTITNWAVSDGLPSLRDSGGVVVTKNKVYYIAGNYVSATHSATINTDGSLGSWVTETSLAFPVNITQVTVFVTKNRVYVIGGYNGTGSSNVSVSYTSVINTSGDLAGWVPTPTPFPVIGYGFNSVVTKNRVYVITDKTSPSTYTATINTDGTLGAWSSHQYDLPEALPQSSLIVTRNRVYLMGGNTGGYASKGYTCTIQSDGTLSNWSISPSLLPSRHYGGSTIVFRGSVFYLAGISSTGYPDGIVYTCPINTDGTLGTWVTSPNAPAAMAGCQLITTGNKIHLVGGWDSSTGARSTVYSATISGGLNDYSYLYDGSVNKFDGTDTAGTVIIGDQIDLTTNYQMPGSGQPWRQQYDINTTQSGDISGWTTGTNWLPANFRHTHPLVTSSRVYLLGGYSGSAFSSAVYTAPINTDGTLGTWTTGTPLPGPVTYSQVVVTKNRVYLLGGSGSAVYTATINTDGTLGAWTTGTSLPGTLTSSCAIVTKNRVYLLGGENSVVVYTAIINTDGTLGAWTTGTSLLNSTLYAQAVVTKNRVYLIGGYVASGVSSSIYTAPINTDGTLGTWSTGPSLPNTLEDTQAIVTRNKLYLLGGSGGAGSAAVHVASINTDGTLGVWSLGTSLPANITASNAVVTKNKVHLLGGIVNSSDSSAVYTAPISGGLNDYSPYYDGTITPVDTQNTINYVMPGSGQPWRQQYDINTTQSGDITGWVTGTALPVAPYRYQVLVTKNRVYLLGGVVNASQSSSVYTVPINTDGTLGTWVIGTSLPDTVMDSQVVVTKNRVYLLGGQGSSGQSKSVYTAPINTDGTLGTWTTGTALPYTIHSSQVIVTKNRLYLLGGVINASVSNVVYTAPINTDGTLGTWTTDTPLINTLYSTQAIVTKNRVYLLGGAVSGSNSANVYTAPVNTDGTLGTWVIGTSLPGTVTYSKPIVTKNRVYLLGGIINGAYSATVYTAPINTDGTLGVWTTGTSLPATIGDNQALVVNSKVYLLGGCVNGVYSNAVYTATISGGLNDYSPYYDGTIQPAAVTSFKLPDFSAAETSGLNYYIKY